MKALLQQFLVIVAIVLLGLLAALLLTVLTAFIHSAFAVVPALTYMQSLVAVLVVWLIVTILR